MLFVFQCMDDPGMCNTWEAFSGANACLIVEPENLTAVVTAPPHDKPLIENAAVITDWHERDDGLSAQEVEAMMADHAYQALDRAVREQTTWSTKLGGGPTWIQNPDENPGGDWRFIGQLDSTLSFLTAPDGALDWVHPDPEQFEGRTHYGEGPIFGDGGIAYLFVRLSNGRPEAAMFWQCG